MKDTLCIDGGHSHHQFGVNLVGFHAIIFTVWISTSLTCRPFTFPLNVGVGEEKGLVRVPHRIRTRVTIVAPNQIAVLTISGIPLRLY